MADFITITVKAARVNKGLHIHEVASHLGMSKATYVKKENGVTRFYADEMFALSKLLDIPILNFFELSCKNKKQNSKQSVS